MHDLRNPLAAIQSAAEMLMDADLSRAHAGAWRETFSPPPGAVRHSCRTCNAFQWRERRDAAPNLREVAEAACQLLSSTAESYGSTLMVEIQREIQLPLQRGRMERVFVNLIGNAIEAMPEGGEARISAEFGTDWVVVHVHDTSPGVVPEIRSQLFQPFVTAGKRNGLGLGLAFTRQAVVEHGGDLWASHAPIGGARFSLRLPGAHWVQPQALAV